MRLLRTWSSEKQESPDVVTAINLYGAMEELCKPGRTPLEKLTCLGLIWLVMSLILVDLRVTVTQERCKTFDQNTEGLLFTVSEHRASSKETIGFAYDAATS